MIDCRSDLPVRPVGHRCSPVAMVREPLRQCVGQHTQYCVGDVAVGDSAAHSSDRVRLLSLGRRSLKRWQLVRPHEHSDGPSLTRRSRNQPASLQRDDHVVHRRRRYPEIALQVRFCRGASVQFRVRGDERQILALEFRKRMLHELHLPAICPAQSSDGLALNREPREIASSTLPERFVGGSSAAAPG